MGAPAADRGLRIAVRCVRRQEEGVKDSAAFRRDAPGATLIVGVSLTSCICRAIAI
jgi:hypothetical protein